MSTVEPLGGDRPRAPLAAVAPAATHPGRSSEHRRDEWHLRSVESSVRLLRSELHACLEGAGLTGDALDDLIMATSEAAANAVEHPQQPVQPFFDVSASIVDGVATITVQDHGQWRQPEAGRDRGWGLAMMHALADVTVVALPHGTTVTIRSRRARLEDQQRHSHGAAAGSQDGGSSLPHGGTTVRGPDASTRRTTRR
jgi:anti-sigma regulatory factor (Ser/Thr protein kinase)